MLVDIAFQTHRFDINEDFGCFPSIFVTWLSVVLLWCPPMVMALLAMFYAGASHAIHLLCSICVLIRYL